VAAGLSQEELARRAGIGRRTLVAFESGERVLVAAAASSLGRALQEAGVDFVTGDGWIGVVARDVPDYRLRRAARAFVGLSQEQAAREAKVGRRAMMAFESETGGALRAGDLALIELFLEKNGISLFSSERGNGVRGIPLRQRTQE
jgi:DNA-binding XRE family transcriptional regulator